MLEYKKPIPVPSDESRPYWEGLKEHRLLMPRCDDCQGYWFPPTQYCPHCSSASWTWTPVSGRGKIFSYVIYHRVYHPGFAEDVPYAVAVISLDEGPRLLSNIVGVPPDQLTCDMPVEVVFTDITDTMTIPKFKPLQT
jgi:hypothetical protein